jgi:hypothetical protein
MQLMPTSIRRVLWKAALWKPNRQLQLGRRPQQLQQEGWARTTTCCHQWLLQQWQRSFSSSSSSLTKHAAMVGGAAY